MKHGTNDAAPVRWAVTFLHWFCPDQLIEGVYGDLLEMYSEDVQNVNTSQANRKFVKNVLRLFHPSIFLRNKLQLNMMSMAMLRSHLLVALRGMKKHKFYSVINIIGLSLAIGFIFLVFLFVKNELDYDQFHTNKDSIYRIYHRVVNVETGEIKSESAVTAIPLSQDLDQDLPSIKEYTRYGSASASVRHSNTVYTETVSYADPGFLRMFDFPLIRGDETTALNLPNAVVLSEESAEKYFGVTDPMNQLLELEIEDSTFHLLVTGVIDTKKKRSSLQFDLLLPFDQYRMAVPAVMMDSYKYSSVENYILMPSEESTIDKERALTEAIQLHSPATEFKMYLGIQRLSKIHFEDSIIGNAIYTSPRKIFILIALALLVLIIAAINFVTLSMGHAINRMAEVGVRKTFGAMHWQLRRQFVIEALLITGVAGLIGVLLARLMMPYYNELVGTSISFSVEFIGIAFVLLMTLVIGIISGAAQSVVLIRQDVARAIKGQVLSLRKRGGLTQGLIVFQFTLSIILIIGAIGIRAQLAYLQNKELGFNKDRLLEIAMNSSSDKEAAKLLLERFRAQAVNSDRILSISGTMNNSRSPWTNVVIQQDDGSNESLYYNQIDPEYVGTMGIQMIAGKDFSNEIDGNANAILVNESLADHFGWDDALGHQIPGKNLSGSHQIVGVFKDFHFSSLHSRIEPLILGVNEDVILPGITGLSTYVWPPNLYQIIVRFGPGEIEPVITHLRNIWDRVNPNDEFVYHFVDEAIEAKYAEDKRWGKVTNLSSLFAIFIAWLGLLGLVRLNVDRRTKEIGIRKVLGSSTGKVIALLSKKYLLLVLLGNIVAWPIAWWLLSKWLQSFDYRIAVHPRIFLIAGLGVFLVVLVSVTLQSLKAAMANPIDAMRVD